MDMSKVFEEFVRRALRKELGLSNRAFPVGNRLPRSVFLDENQEIKVEPDLSWWDGTTCMFAGDVKYKRVRGERVPNADLYQLFAYAAALDLPAGLLVYAEDEANAVVHRVRNAGKRLEIATLDLSGSIESLHVGIADLARRIRGLRVELAGNRIAA